MNGSKSADAETFAAYLAKYYTGRKGFSTETVPEAAALAQACDFLLTRADGMTLQLLCIVDRDAHPEKTFALSREALEEIGRSCLKYTGKIGGRKLPLSIQVMEIGAGPAAEPDRARLRALKGKSLFSKVAISSWKLDTAAATAWTNAPLGGFFLGRRGIERLMRAPRLSGQDLRPPEIVFSRTRFPLVTTGLLALLAAVFACELAFGIGPWSGLLAPSVRTLVALGGLSKPLVLQSGEWYRIFSAAFLHADIVHLLLNGFCLYLAGSVLESFIGRRWFAALFVIGAVSGSLVSLALNPPSVISVGASGAIMGLLAAAFVCSFRYPSGALRTRIQMVTLQVLIPSLIPLAVSRTGQHIDFGAHLGGALSGAVVGFWMLRTWRLDSPRPALPAMAAAVCAAGALAILLALLPLARGYHGYALDAFLIPHSQLPKSNDEAKANAADLIARYPHDPRSRLYQAIALVDRRDVPGAERELRAGLAEEEILRTKFKPELEAHLRGLLALLLTDTGQRSEAITVAQPACGESSATFASMRGLLVRAGLCGG